MCVVYVYILCVYVHYVCKYVCVVTTNVYDIYKHIFYARS